ncbi:MAG: M50 family metallopeptidase [Dethiobacteria bacterium]
MNWRLLKFGKLEITISPFFLLLITLWLLAGLPWETLFLFVLVLGHELTHTLVAKFCGMSIYRIELFPFGGAGYLTKPVELEPKKEFVIAGAGPAFNLVLFIILWNYGYGGYNCSPMFGDDLLAFLLKANLFLFAFNLLPGLPLDGGRLLRAALGQRVGFYKATETALAYGRGLGVIFLFTGFVLSYFDYFNLSLSLVGLFLYYAAGREQKKSIYVFLRYLIRKERSLHKERVLKGEQLVALDSTSVLEVLKQFKSSRYHQVIILSQTCRFLEMLSESQILAGVLQKGTDITMGQLLRRG